MSERSPALWGWLPPPQPAQNLWARRIDRFLPHTALPCLLYIIAIVGLLNLAPHLPARGGLGLEGLAFLAAGGWCGLNFSRCRQAHCLVSGGGWLGLSVLTFIEAGLGHSVIRGFEEPVFLGVLVVAVLFEGAWYLGRGTNAVISEVSPPKRRAHKRFRTR